jgi:signal transduction histidine kinase
MITVAATAALVGLVTAVVAARTRARRRRLREAVHELRRPLTAMLLAAGDGDQTAALREQIQVALRDLDGVLDGAPRARSRDRMPVSRLLAEARLRWGGAGVRIAEAGPNLEVAGDRVHLGMALDNLIANGLEHGTGEVLVDAQTVADGCRLEVRNGAGPAPDVPRSDPARGHGLRIAARELEREGGRLIAPRRSAAGVVAALELPSAPPRGPRRP